MRPVILYPAIHVRRCHTMERNTSRWGDTHLLAVCIVSYFCMRQRFLWDSWIRLRNNERFAIYIEQGIRTSFIKNGLRLSWLGVTVAYYWEQPGPPVPSLHLVFRKVLSWLPYYVYSTQWGAARTMHHAQWRPSPVGCPQTSSVSTPKLGGVVGLMLPLALAAAVRVPYTTSPCSDLGQVVNLSLSAA